MVVAVAAAGPRSRFEGGPSGSGFELGSRLGSGAARLFRAGGMARVEPELVPRP